MRNVVVAFGVLTHLLCVSCSADARGMGRFMGGLLARGAANAAVHSTTSSSSSVKSYTPDVLTVTQLAQCIKKASRLDEESDRLETSRTALQSSTSQVDMSLATIEQQRSRLDRSSRASVNSFNALIDRHNTLVTAAKTKQVDFNSAIDAHNSEVNVYNGDCAKKYYADDLTEAQKLAGINGG